MYSTNNKLYLKTFPRVKKEQSDKGNKAGETRSEEDAGIGSGFSQGRSGLTLGWDKRPRPSCGLFPWFIHFWSPSIFKQLF